MLKIETECKSRQLNLMKLIRNIGIESNRFLAARFWP